MLQTGTPGRTACHTMETVTEAEGEAVVEAGPEVGIGSVDMAMERTNAMAGGRT